MRIRQVLFHPEAVAEANAAVQWYRERSSTAANALISEIDCLVTRIAESPETWPCYIWNTRRILLQRFPFSIIYRISFDHIEVIAVAHGRRKPGYWKNRLG